MYQAIRRERSVVIQLTLGIIGLAVCFWLRYWVDFILILAVTGFMITSELFNTCIEWICDFIQPADDPRIRAIKDASSAATGISVLVWSGRLLEACRDDPVLGYNLMRQLLLVVSERLDATRLQLMDTYSLVAARAGA